MRRLVIIGALVVFMAGCQKAPTTPEAALQAKSGVVLPGGGSDYVQFLDAQDMIALGMIQAPTTDKVDLPWKPGDASLNVSISCADLFQTLEALGVINIPDNVTNYVDCQLNADSQLPPSYLTISALAGWGTSYQGFAGVAAGAAVGIIAWGKGNSQDPIMVDLSILVNGTFERQFGGSFSFGSVAELAYGAAAFLRIPPQPVGIQIMADYLYDAGPGVDASLSLNFQGKWAGDGSFDLKPVAAQKPFKPVASLN